MDTPDQGRTFATQAINFIRTAMMVDLTLSRMADQKASILMGATFVVFTIAVGQASGGTLPLAMMVLALFSLLAAVLAVLVVLPTIRPPKVSPGGENLLFFGVFSEIEEDVWIDRVLAGMASDESLFRMMLRDIWQNGRVLKRKKYRFLGWAYRTFLCGLALTLAALLFEILR
jgi:hypothetical protein